MFARTFWNSEEQKIIDQYNSEEIKYLSICMENNIYWITMLTDIKIYVRKNKIRRIKNEQTSKYATIY